MEIAFLSYNRNGEFFKIMRIRKWNRKQILLALLTAAWILFIFGNSMQPASVSASQSGCVLQMIEDFFRFLGMPVTFTQFIVRKTAHFIEYTVLGVFLILTLNAFTSRLLSHIFQPLFIGLAVPVADESIQLFVDGRAGMVQDVVLDFLGALTGLTLTSLILLWRKKRRMRSSG